MLDGEAEAEWCGTGREPAFPAPAVAGFSCEGWQASYAAGGLGGRVWRWAKEPDLVEDGLTLGLCQTEIQAR